MRQRTGALVRLARVLRKLGNNQEALAAYAQLATLADVRVAGLPVELIARHALAELSGRPDAAEDLLGDLKAARWRLTRGQFEFYWGEAARLTGRAVEPAAERKEWSEIAGEVWREIGQDGGARGQRTVWMGERAVFAMWRGTREHRALLASTPEMVLKPALAGLGVSAAVVDTDGKVVAGRRAESGRAAVRMAVESRLPWTLYISSTRPAAAANVTEQQRFLWLAGAVMAIFLAGGGTFVVRAVRAGSGGSRMQSDFVSAVSHEFRSPLTSIRQLSEMLALGRVEGAGRRQAYYETLVRETARLQRLVEGLLHFGRMEAGAKRYRFEELEAGDLVGRVVADFEPQMAGSGRRIEVEGQDGKCRIDADPDALSVALRNLVDNALKYWPRVSDRLGGMGARSRARGDSCARSGSGNSGGGTARDLREVCARERGGGGERERVGRGAGDGAAYCGSAWRRDSGGRPHGDRVPPRGRRSLLRLFARRGPAGDEREQHHRQSGLAPIASKGVFGFSCRRLHRSLLALCSAVRGSIRIPCATGRIQMPAGRVGGFRCGPGPHLDSQRCPA